MQSTNFPYAFHTWQKYWVWVKAKQALIHMILESQRGTFAPILWDRCFCYPYVLLWNLGLPYIHIALLIAISSVLCCCSSLLLRIPSASGYCGLAHVFVEVRENLLAASRYEFCRITTGASKVLLGTDLWHSEHSQCNLHGSSLTKAGFLLLFKILLMHEEIQIQFSFSSSN